MLILKNFFFYWTDNAHEEKFKPCCSTNSGKRICLFRNNHSQTHYQSIVEDENNNTTNNTNDVNENSHNAINSGNNKNNNNYNNENKLRAPWGLRLMSTFKYNKLIEYRNDFMEI